MSSLIIGISPRNSKPLIHDEPGAWNSERILEMQRRILA